VLEPMGWKWNCSPANSNKQPRNTQRHCKQNTKSNIGWRLHLLYYVHTKPELLLDHAQIIQNLIWFEWISRHTETEIKYSVKFDLQYLQRKHLCEVSSMLGLLQAALNYIISKFRMTQQQRRYRSWLGNSVTGLVLQCCRCQSQRKFSWTSVLQCLNDSTPQLHTGTAQLGSTRGKRHQLLLSTPCWASDIGAKWRTEVPHRHSFSPG
jgi:hypothetical protein